MGPTTFTIDFDDNKRMLFTGWLLADITHPQDEAGVHTLHKMALFRTIAGAYIFSSSLRTDPPGGADEHDFIVTRPNIAGVFLMSRGAAARKLYTEAGLTAEYETFLHNTRIIKMRAAHAQQIGMGIQQCGFDNFAVVICDFCGRSCADVGKSYYEGDVTAEEALLLCEGCHAEFCGMFTAAASKPN